MVKHLGFQLNLQEGVLQVPTPKLKAVRKELGKIVTNRVLSCRKMSSILGGVRSFLQAMPFLRAFTDDMLSFIRQNSVKGWDYAWEVPPPLKAEVVKIGQLMSVWKGRVFDGNVCVRKLHSDSSALG